MVLLWLLVVVVLVVVVDISRVVFNRRPWDEEWS
jgi:hypothetical protein